MANNLEIERTAKGDLISRIFYTANAVSRFASREKTKNV